METGGFLGLYDTIGFMVERGSPDVVFFNYNTIKINPRFSIRIKEEGFQTLSLAPFSIATG